MSQTNSKNKENLKLNQTPDFDAMIRVVLWNSLGFIFFTFIKSWAVKYFFGGSDLDLGFIFSLQPLARLISMPLIGFLTDHSSSKKPLILIGSVSRTISYIIYFISLCMHNLFLFGVGIFCQGLLVGFFWPPYLSLISEKSFKAYRTQALAVGRSKMIGIGYLIGAVISMPIVTLVIIFIPDDNPLLVPLLFFPLLIFAAINLISGIRFYMRVDENLTYDKYVNSLNGSGLLLNNLKGKAENAEMIENTENIEITEDTVNEEKKSQKGYYIGFIVLTLVILVTSINATIYTPFLSVYLIETLLSDTIIDIKFFPIILMIIYFPAQVISQLLAPRVGKFIDRIGPHSVTLLSVFRAIMIGLLIYAFSVFDFAFYLIFLYMSTISITYLTQAIMSRISIKHRGKMLGFNMWIDRLGMVIGPLIGATILMYTSAYKAPFIFSIFLGLSLIPFFIFAIRKLNPYMSEQV
ncbi:MAG: MFS transporter [Promethearchaeota archaeon]